MKSFLNNIKIGRRLNLIFAIILTLVVGTVTYILLNMRTIREAIDEIYKVNLLSVDYLIEADRDAYQSNLAISQALQDIINSDDVRFEETEATIWENYDQISERYGYFETSFKIEEKPEYTEKNAEFHSGYAQLKTETESILENLKSNNSREAERIYYSSYDSTFEAMRNIMNDFTEMSLANADKFYQESNSIASRINTNSIAASLITIIILVIAAIVLTRSITNPVSEAVTIIKTIAKGDLTKKVVVKGKDEIAELLQAVSLMSEKLKNIINDIIESSESLSTASSQISNSSQQISEGATEQASSTEEISSSMEEMVSNIQQNTDNAKQTETISSTATDSMVEMNKIGRESFDSIQTIAEKITIINDIAFQTNLLALNAAVEAARAGEHGRGFAVVAAEVRKLAERSKLAADEIENLSKNSLKITEKTRESLDSLVPEIQKTSQLVQEIAAASIEQNSGADQINSAIQQLNLITQQNAASSEEMASSAEELSSQAENLRDAVSYFNVEKVDKFSKKEIVPQTDMKKHNNGNDTGDKKPLSAKVKKAISESLKEDTHKDDDTVEADFESYN